MLNFIETIGLYMFYVCICIGASWFFEKPVVNFIAYMALALAITAKVKASNI